MKSTMDGLTPKEQTALALWYDTDSYKAFKHLLELERLNIATKLLLLDPVTEMVPLARHQGRADSCKQLHLTLKQNYKNSVKADNQKG